MIFQAFDHQLNTDNDIFDLNDDELQHVAGGPEEGNDPGH